MGWSLEPASGSGDAGARTERPSKRLLTFQPRSLSCRASIESLRTLREAPQRPAVIFVFKAQAGGGANALKKVG